MFLSPGGTNGATLNPGDPASGEDDNYGPHCRNCHTGASSCNQCHGVNSATGVANGAYEAWGANPPNTEGKTSFMPNAYVHTPAVAGLNSQCIDGGFSFPHRTLGANMLKDEIYGIDYDGTPVAAGDDRTAGAGIDLAAYGNIGGQTWYNSWVSENTTDTSLGYGKWVESGTQLATDTAIAAENLDSVCLDCHGDSTYWNGDDTTYWTPGKGWELLVKGLP